MDIFRTRGRRPKAAPTKSQPRGYRPSDSSEYRERVDGEAGPSGHRYRRNRHHKLPPIELRGEIARCAPPRVLEEIYRLMRGGAARREECRT